MEPLFIKTLIDAGSWGLVCLFFVWLLMKELPRLHKMYADELREIRRTYESECAKTRLIFMESLDKMGEKILPCKLVEGCKWKPTERAE